MSGENWLWREAASIRRCLTLPGGCRKCVALWSYDRYRAWAMAQAGTQQAVDSLDREMTTLCLDETGA
jgi:hypothetical protein